MATELATQDTLLDPAMVEKILVEGDLEALSPRQRLDYYTAVCKSVGLNPLTKPFSYIKLNGKLQLYALKETTDQLRKNHRISIHFTERQMIGESYVVTACATMPDGRTDESTGAVWMAGLKGDAHPNALMKAETKAKRRATLSIAGLGMLDETEADSIKGAEVGVVNVETGELMDAPAAAPTRKPRAVPPAPVIPEPQDDDAIVVEALTIPPPTCEGSIPDTPALTPDNIGKPICQIHEVAFEAMKSAKSGVTRWCHSKDDGGYCVFDGDDVPLFANPS